jgi:4-hydroxy-3-polyprenylbenzoate decarboxylase
MPGSYIVAITGASGSIYGLRLTEALIEHDLTVYLVISSPAFTIMSHETGIDWTGATDSEVNEKIRRHFSSERVRFFSDKDLSAPISSGSFITDGMFIVPCSMKTLSGIANGYANNLIERAADVVLKEGRRLILSPREMPFNAVHLENMLKLARMGVTIAPPIPAYYHRPHGIDDLVDFVVGKLMDSMGIRHEIFNRWR